VLCPLLWVTLLGQGVGLGDPQRSLPTPAMLGFCDSVTMLHPGTGSSICCSTYHHEVFGSVLDGPKNTQNNGHDVQKVSQDGCPLVAQEIKDLPLQRRYLQQSKGGVAGIKAGHRSPQQLPGC